MEVTIEHELQRFIEVWVTVFASLTYCYFISRSNIIPKGFIRLLSLLPIITIFTLLPFSLSSMIFSSPTGFLVGWLANFNLLLLAFDKGPLSSSSLSSNNISLPLFILLACLPIKIKQNPSPKIITKSSQNSTDDQNQILSSSSSSSSKSNKPHKSHLYYGIQGSVLALVLCVYEYKHYLHPNLILLLYCILVFSAVELFLAMFAVLPRLLVGLEMEPQFNYPLLSTSLQDFWGRRWNLTVSGLLRSTVYEPVRNICTHNLGRWWARTIGILSTFVVSGLMHELVFFYMGRLWPTWDVTWTFVLQGVCLILEIELKEALKSRFRLHRLVSGPLTIGFVVVTGMWLYFPVYGRVGVIVKMNEEIGILGEFVKGVAKKSWISVPGWNQSIYHVHTNSY
ncbi:hypothetical protein BVC80_9047g55 [Macleaya cordata]|uniref:Wax synthase domain-containing protein n=1 Tax=Macleaya cordata TaxID=56857 RepID=A0A200R304_MACCD|nr:hypothetical protein BVC80_9047g55 [Macleaya cordata]